MARSLTTSLFRLVPLILILSQKLKERLFSYLYCLTDLPSYVIAKILGRLQVCHRHSVHSPSFPAYQCKQKGSGDGPSCLAPARPNTVLAANSPAPAAHPTLLLFSRWTKPSAAEFVVSLLLGRLIHRLNLPESRPQDVKATLTLMQNDRRLSGA